MNVDINLKLLSGEPIPFSSHFSVVPLTLNDIKNIGYQKYNEGLGFLCLDTTDIKEKLNISEDISTLDFLKVNVKNDGDFADFFTQTLSMYIDANVKYDKSINQIIIENETNREIIDESVYETIKYILRLQNCLDGADGYQDNPANEKARQLLEKKRKLKKKLNKAQNQNSEDDPLTLYDLISILASSGSNYNLINRLDNPMNVWNLTMFQFENAFNRLKMFSDYTVNIQALIHGAKPDDIGFKHFISKISRD